MRRRLVGEAGVGEHGVFYGIVLSCSCLALRPIFSCRAGFIDL